ncbi:MAG: hypothetical protein EAZ89_17675 [Bacteroidetes bacterium]|jgi:cell division protein FtsL|nr:MAG: hypothetical protein EAZ89_17675 [Bacteroidota bacterium]
MSIAAIFSLLLQEQKAWLLMSDKVYSVLAVLLIIFGLLIAFMVFTNRRISDLEQKMTEEKTDSEWENPLNP